MKDKNQVPDYTREEDNTFIPNAIYGSTTPIVHVPPEASGTTVEILANSFNDDVAQYLKGDNAELLRVRNQAMNAPVPDANNVPPLIGRQDSDPKGG